MNSKKQIRINVRKGLPGEITRFKVPVRRVPHLRALSPQEFWRLLNEFARLPAMSRSDWRILRRAINHLR